MDALNIPVIQGTTRPKRQSIKVSKFIVEVGKEIDGVDTFLVDPNDFDTPFDGNDDENKDPKYSKITKDADAFFFVVPEYNHGFSGTLKRFIDSELQNYNRKPVAFAGVSSGQWGGVRAIESILPIVRGMGLVATYQDVHFPKVQDLFDEQGNILDESYKKRVLRSFDDLIWMAKALKWGRENISD